MAASARKDKPKKSPAKAKPVKKERPAHWKEGQKHELNPPLETEPLYVFYTSLRRQRPASEMAETWMLEHGLLENRELDAALKKRNLGKAKRTTAVKRESGRAKTESPAKRAIKPKITIKKPAAASTPEKKPAPKAVKVKAIVESDTDDDDVPIGVMLKRTGEA